MDKLRDWSLRLIIALNVIALVVSFGESFAGLFQWASHHSITGFGAAVWPLMIDVMILVGEAGLFVAHHGHWRLRDKAWLWFIVVTALGVSAAGNIGHIVSTDWLTHLTAALPPVALFFSMTVGFGVMKRVYLNKPGLPLTEPPAPSHVLPETVPVPVAGTTDLTAYIGTTPWAENGLPGFERAAGTVAPTLPDAPENAVIPPSLEPTETFASPGFKVTGKSYTQPRDSRQGLKLPEQRVRDMFDIDPDVSVNAIAKALGVHWQTAKNYLTATKEARGLEVP